MSGMHDLVNNQALLCVTTFAETCLLFLDYCDCYGKLSEYCVQIYSKIVESFARSLIINEFLKGLLS